MKRGTVVLSPFPFTDLTGRIRRFPSPFVCLRTQQAARRFLAIAHEQLAEGDHDRLDLCDGFVSAPNPFPLPSLPDSGTK
jgi:hypothetical protein